jgi:acetylornithine deacetylase/succinyl-diaminopimelate desuccinylase-like protein
VNYRSTLEDARICVKTLVELGEELDGRGEERIAAMGEESWITSEFEHFLTELETFLRIPSISARPEHAPDVARTANWLVDHLTRIGLTAERIETQGHPLVFAEDRSAGPGRPTVLIYGHYDVQPPDPEDAWDTPPFAPARRDGRIYARGATDNKGQLFIHLKALQAVRNCSGSLPVNVKLLLEGEEEVGSPGAFAFVQAHADRLAADLILVSDSNLWSEDQPSILVGLRGIAYLDVEVYGPSEDLHSGVYGGTVVNPANALVRMLAGLQDADGRVTAPGFYDRIEPLDSTTRELLPDDYGNRVESETGVPALGGELDRNVAERAWFRPTFDVHGLDAGYKGVGAKTVIPARSTAKMSSRLVAGQDPSEIAELLANHLQTTAPDGVRVEVRTVNQARPWRAQTDHWAFGLAREALGRWFPRPALLVGEGGSVPLIPALERAAGAPPLLVGFGLPGSNAHAPNEWISIRAFERGVLSVFDLLQRIGSKSV